MSRRWVALTLVIAIPGFVLSQQADDKPAAFKSLKEKVSYSIGVSIGKSLKDDGVEIDDKIFTSGVQHGLGDKKTLMTQDEMDEALADFQKELEAKRTEKTRVAGEKHKKEGEMFLAENKKKTGVKTTASGLQYKVIKAGTGKMPKLTDTVVTHYKGTLIDGTKFDSSYDRGEPASFPVKGVIKGWTEALQLMKVGDKWQLFIPSELGYGARGAGNEIPPHAVLIFEIELLEVK